MALQELARHRLSDLLRTHNVTLCVHDMPGSEAPLTTVGPIAYVRFHGYGVKYGGSYPLEVLQEWAACLRRVVATGRETYVYFNNDVDGYAVYEPSACVRSSTTGLRPDSGKYA